jgi:hypothetical protein
MADDYGSRIKKIASQQRKGGSSSYASKIQKIAAEQGGSSGTNWKAAAAAGSASSAEKEKGPVAWILDILDRPGNAIRTGISEGINDVYKGAKSGRLKPATKDSFGQALGLNNLGTAGAFFGGAARGLGEGISGNKHATTSKIIEDVTDDIGSGDPAYKNTKDNANPWVKGIGGFIGDVALDPLTYVPGADLISVAGKTVKGVKAGTEAVKAAETGATVAEKATAAVKAGAKAATKRTTKVPPAVPRQETKVSEDLVARIAENQAPKVTAAVPSEVPVAPRPSR